MSRGPKVRYAFAAFICIFSSFHAPHQWMMFIKLLYLVFVSFHCYSLIIVNLLNHKEIFFALLDDIPLLNVNFLLC